MRKFNKEDAIKYRDNMAKDGWEFSKIFSSDDEYYKGTKEGFTCHINLREKAVDDLDRDYGRLSFWDNRDLAVEPPYPNYSWELLVKNTLKCDFCGEYVDRVVKIAFANKACKKCEKNARKEYEYDGWCL